MVPKSYVGKSPAMVVIALQFGMELGLQPMQSLQNIANINGNPSIWGDAALALCINSPVCEYVIEDDLETIKKYQKAVCKAKRRNSPVEVVRTFSYEDAKVAKIFENAVWKTYPQRMCQMRARSFCLRDTFPDVLKGLALAEEVMDYSGQTIESTSIPASAKDSPSPTPAPEPTIGRDKATAFYKLYKVNGWSPDESKAFLKEAFGIEPPKTSADIPVAEEKKAMDWAGTKAPIRVEADGLFESLGYTDKEFLDFCNARKWNFVKIIADQKAEIERRNAQEQ